MNVLNHYKNHIHNINNTIYNIMMFHIVSINVLPTQKLRHTFFRHYIDYIIFLTNVFVIIVLK